MNWVKRALSAARSSKNQTSPFGSGWYFSWYGKGCQGWVCRVVKLKHFDSPALYSSSRAFQTPGSLAHRLCHG